MNFLKVINKYLVVLDISKVPISIYHQNTYIG